ncbi:MAG: cytochrome c [Sphingobacteriaceae bacterium]|nr:cytochrome c [Sphingobacteriaceae bacterium]
MPTKTKRIIFWSLILLFGINSIFIYLSGTQRQILNKLSIKEASRGKLLFQEYNCIACHQIYGLGGYMGPDLTNVISEKSKGKDYAQFFLKYGSNRMPNFNLNETEINDLLSYLAVVDQTGISPVKKFNTTFLGTIVIEK